MALRESVYKLDLIFSQNKNATMHRHKLKLSELGGQ